MLVLSMLYKNTYFKIDSQRIEKFYSKKYYEKKDDHTMGNGYHRKQSLSPIS